MEKIKNYSETTFRPIVHEKIFNISNTFQMHSPKEPISIYIDSNVIVSSEISSESTHKASKKFIDYVLQNKNENIIFSTSIFTYLELASAIIRRTKTKDRAYSLLYRVTKSWKNSINPLPIIRGRPSFTDMIDNLVETTIKYRTNSADTLHAHAIAENKIDYFVTWNKAHFRHLARQVRNLKILTPTEMLEVL